MLIGNNKTKFHANLNQDLSGASSIQKYSFTKSVTLEIQAIKEELINLYAFVKIRKNNEVFKMNEEL